MSSKHISMFLSVTCMSSLEKKSISSAHFLIVFFFFFDVQLYEFFVYFDINILLDILLANIFLFSRMFFCYFFFKFLYIFLHFAKAFHLEIFPFVYFWFYFTEKANILLRPMSKSLLHLLSSRSFMVSRLTFKSLSWSDLIVS